MIWKKLYKKDLVESGRSENTVEAYLSDLKQFQLWFERVNGEELRPSRITGVDCLDFRSHQLEVEEVAPSTWNRRRASLIVFTRWSINKGFIKEDPMRGVNEKEVEDLPPRWLDEAEYRMVVRQLDKDVNRAQTKYELRTALMYRAIVSLMLYAGLRVSEVCDLRSKDLCISERKGEVTIRAGKGDKHAKLPLNAKARRAITAWTDYRKRNLRFVGARNSLWIGRKGESLSPRSVQNRVQGVAKRLGLEMTPHTFRHTFVRRLLVVKGLPLNIVQKFARHAKMETTLSYARVSWGDLERAAESL